MSLREINHTNSTPSQTNESLICTFFRFNFLEKWGQDAKFRMCKVESAYPHISNFAETLPTGRASRQTAMSLEEGNSKATMD